LWEGCALCDSLHWQGKKKKKKKAASRQLSTLTLGIPELEVFWIFPSYVSAEEIKVKIYQ
jgi:hypothetical protein